MKKILLWSFIFIGFFFFFILLLAEAEGHIVFFLQSKQKSYSSNLQVLTMQEIPVSPRKTMECYSIMIRFFATHVWAGSNTSTAEKRVDVMKHIFCKSAMESNALSDFLSPLQPAHTYGCPATSLSDKGFRRHPGSKNQSTDYHADDFKGHCAHSCTFALSNLKDKV